MGAEPFRLGRYRIVGPGGEECAVVHRDAGDAAPCLPRWIYETLHFEPGFDELPFARERDGLRPLVWLSVGDPVIG